MLCFQNKLSSLSPAILDCRCRLLGEPTLKMRFSLIETTFDDNNHDNSNRANSGNVDAAYWSASCVSAQVNAYKRTTNNANLWFGVSTVWSILYVRKAYKLYKSHMGENWVWKSFSAGTYLNCTCFFLVGRRLPAWCQRHFSCQFSCLGLKTIAPFDSTPHRSLGCMSKASCS